MLKKISFIALPLIISTVSGCQMTATASVKSKVDNVEVEAKVVIQNHSQPTFLELFAPEMFKEGVIQLSNLDASSLEFEIKNIYNVTEIEDNMIIITLTSDGKELANAPFSVFKDGSNYKLRDPDAFILWAQPYKNVADGFKLNLNTIARQIQNPSKFTLSSKYKTFEFLTTTPVTLDGCDLPEFPVPDPSQYCNY